jgi:hypothetical protein
MIGEPQRPDGRDDRHLEGETAERLRTSDTPSTGCTHVAVLCVELRELQPAATQHFDAGTRSGRYDLVADPANATVRRSQGS